MDTQIVNGDWQTNANGIPIAVSGVQEQLQRAFFRLRTPKGSFVYDPSLGSRLYTLKPNDNDLNAKALTLAQEAVKNMPKITVESAACTTAQNGKLSILILLQTAQGKGSVTVKI